MPFQNCFGRLFGLLILLSTCLTCSNDPPTRITIHVAADAPMAFILTADDLAAGFQQMGAGPIGRSTSMSSQCESRHIQIRLEIDPEREPHTYRIDEIQCPEEGKLIQLQGGGILSSQWAAYDLLRQVGVRFFHPEETYYPASLVWPEGPLQLEERPSFQERAISVHRTHPVELSAPLDDSQFDMQAHQMKWIDWNVALRTTQVNGWDTAYVDQYAYNRGFPRVVGFNLVSTQQGGVPIIDPDDPRTEEEQMAESIQKRIEPADGLPKASIFSFNFTPSEFTEEDPVDTVRRLTFITDYITEYYPDVSIWTINHGTHQEPNEEFNLRFSSLPALAPPELGVKVHTLMFYDLVRDAPVYGNANFNYLLDFIREESAVRRISHYPESSWWLTFDLPIPLFLAPVTLEARQHDLDAISDLLSTSRDDPSGLYGHRLFSSGQEWGYWMIDYCFTHMSWDVSFSHTDCIADIASLMTQPDAFISIWEEVEERQVSDMRDAERLRYLVGSDEETEVAFDIGIHFHPLPPHPKEILAYSDQEIEALQVNSLSKLNEMADDYESWTERVEALLPLQGTFAASILREFRDGLIIFALRARHAVSIYETAIDLRAALADGDLDAINQAYEGVEEARGITEEARLIIHRRESEYRYPLGLSTAGDEPGTPGAIENKTIYPYRYLSRTHRVFYWTRPDEQLASLFGEGLELVIPNRRILLHEEPLDIQILADEIFELSIDRGDGTVSSSLEPYSYNNQQIYSWILDATTSSGAVHHEDQVAPVSQRFIFPKGYLRVQEPEGAAALNGLLPGLIIGYAQNEGVSSMILGQVEESVSEFQDNLASAPLIARSRNGAISGPEDLALDVEGVGLVQIYDAMIEVVDDVPPDGKQLFIEGTMNTDEIISLLVGVGGFEENGARELIATLLDYTPETLPELIDFTIFSYGKEDLSALE